MGRLIDHQKRERAKQQRVDRKHRIREEALASFMRLPYVEVTLDSIGQRAQVNRGITSMYFRSKEELFLLLLKDELETWYEGLGNQLQDLDGPQPVSRLAVLLAGSVANRPTVTRLLSMAPMVLEQNLDLMEVFRFQRWRRDLLVSLGEILEGVSDRRIPGGGARMLFLVQLTAAAFHSAAHPLGSAALEAGDPDFAVFFVDMENEMTMLIEAILNVEQS